MELKKPIKGIFFDIGWTMNQPKHHWMINEIFFQLVDETTIRQLERKLIEDVLTESMLFLNNNHLVKTVEEEYEQFRTFYGMIAVRIPELKLSSKSIDTLAYDKVYNDKNYIFFDDVIPTLEKLKGKYKLGIISDTWPSVARVLKNAGIYDYFDSITFSCNLGVFKPNSLMYEHAINSIGLLPSETVFIDDSVSCLGGAKEYGIQPVMIKRRKEEQPISDYTVITSLSEIVDLLK